MTMRRVFLALTAAAAALSLHARKARAQGKRPNSGRGIPGATNMDHVGLTVPNLDETVRFFVEVLGADDTVHVTMPQNSRSNLCRPRSRCQRRE